jgi:L-threonylcarbamoyladenylate synthase
MESADIVEAALALTKGNLVAFPTETVYGLGADAVNEMAVAQIYRVKGRPIGHPVIVHISSLNQLDKWVREVPEYAIKLAAYFWPGPMTLIFKRSALAKDFITGGQDNVAVRVPSHKIANDLLKNFESLGGHGIAAPSANRFGKVSPTTSRAVEEELGNYLSSYDRILHGGVSQIGIESTIIDCTEKIPLILRPGAIDIRVIQDKFDLRFRQSDTTTLKLKAPGLLRAHYSPEAIVKLNGKTEEGDGFIALASFVTPKGAIRLASPKSIEEFAQLLYSSLRYADKIGIKTIQVIPPPSLGIGEAINDRLQKAALGHIGSIGIQNS